MHLQAFRAAAYTLGAAQFACFPDCDDVWDVFYEGGSYGDVVPVLEHYFGPLQPSVNEIAAEFTAEADHTVPGVWYYENLRNPYDDR